jgi:hypothetical protein
VIALSQTGTRKPKMVGRQLGDLVAPALGKALAARGFAAADVVMAWREIVGERLAAVCEPSALEWPRGRGHEERGEGATLVMRAEPGFALELQHLAPLILERINTYFGWRCVEKLAIRQGRMRKKAKVASSPKPSDAASRARAEEIAGDIAEEALRQSLIGLGAQVLAKR